ncbi:MAG: hypothetical protein ACTSP4_15595, partial [Candidatus Hodarchaeales archaeon]
TSRSASICILLNTPTFLSTILKYTWKSWFNAVIVFQIKHCIWSSLEFMHDGVNSKKRSTRVTISSGISESL